MNKKFSDSELILREDGSVYHLGVVAADVADNVIIVGDPDRVEMISSRFDEVSVRKSSREFCVHTGLLNGKKLTVISTGIGVDNIDIVINELDAAVNINPETREVNPSLRKLNFIRLGTSGAMQPDIDLHDVVCSAAAIGMDGVPHFYQIDWTNSESDLVDRFSEECSWPAELARPYAVEASEELLRKFSDVYTHKGITVTANGFYGPQNRQLRVPLRIQKFEDYKKFEWEGMRVTNFEMETAGIYALSKSLGHAHVTLCVILANRSRKLFSSNPQKAVESLIDKALKALTR